jgi:ferritin-like metal-binding protein YciE
MQYKNTIDRQKISDGSCAGKELQHRTIIRDVFDAAPNRRGFVKTVGMAGALAGAVTAVDGVANAQSSFTDFDILNFALNLEYLEAEFYTVATTGQTISQAGLSISGSGTSGPTTGGSRVARDHVKFIQTATASLGGTSIAKPAINLNALGLGFSSVNAFLTPARIFEDIGVTAYGGAAPLIKNPGLSAAFKNHLKETEKRVARLEEVGKLLEIKPTGKKCQGMEGVIKEGAEALEEEGNEVVFDLGIIGASSRVEHYEMAGYLTAISLAERIGAKDVVSLLQKSLTEERAAEQTLRKIASGLIKILRQPPPHNPATTKFGSA